MQIDSYGGDACNVTVTRLCREARAERMMEFLAPGLSRTVLRLKLCTISSLIQENAALQAFRSLDTGQKLLIDENDFEESFRPSSAVRKLSNAEMDHYRESFKTPPSCEPLYRWPNEASIHGSSATRRKAR